MSSDSELRVQALVYTTVAVIVIAAASYVSLAALRQAVVPGRASAASSARTGPAHLLIPPPSSDLPAPDPQAVRVCADPNNLPFSNERHEGFENAIASLVARDLGRHLEYYWQPQRRGFLRTTLNAGYCDVVIGLPARSEMARTTAPYYRSTYVFVTRSAPLERRTTPAIRSLDDPRLHMLRIGVEMTGEDYDNPPAVQALAARHIVNNVRGFLVYGDYSQPDPPSRVIDAVSRGEVDTAIAWGPMAAFFAHRSQVPLSITPVTPAKYGPVLVFTYDIAMGVRRGDTALRDALDRVLIRRRVEIQRTLDRFHVPQLPLPGGA